MELFPELKTLNFFQRAFLGSLVWRSPEKTSSATRELLSELWKEGRFIESIYDVFLMCSCEPEHILNASSLHRHLASLNMPERDAIWSIYLHDQYDSYDHGPMYRLIEWAWQANKESTEDWVIELCAITLSWFLTSSNRFLRDRATKALASMLGKRPQVLPKIIDHFRNIDDPYVTERLCAVAYGTVVLSENTSAIQEIAASIYGLVFSQRRPPTHLLLRDYARGVIETAIHKNARPSTVALHSILPPYESSWPLQSPDPDQLEPYKERPENKNDPAWSRVWLYHSIVGDSDFTRYAIDQGCGHFSQHSLSDTTNLHAGDRGTTSKLRDDQFDCGVAQRWMALRVFNLGWTVERFGQFDKRLDRLYSLHETCKPERLGKKYTWIALHELLARLSDNVEYREDSGGLEPTLYNGPWQLYRRDIDPCLMQKTHQVDWGKGRETWWQPVDYAFDERNEERFEAWTSDFQDLFDPVEMIEVEHPEGSRWLVLESNFRRVEQPPIEEDEYKVLRRNVGLAVTGYFVQADHAEALLKWLKGQQFWRLPEPVTIRQVFLGEYPWAPSFKEYDAADSWEYGNYLDQPHPMVVSSAWYSWERELRLLHR